MGNASLSPRERGEKNISAAGGVHQSETKKVWNRLCSAGGVEGGRRHYEGQSHQKVEKKLHSCNAIDTTASFGFSFFLLFTLAVSTCTVNSLFLSRFLSLSLSLSLSSFSFRGGGGGGGGGGERGKSRQLDTGYVYEP